MRPVRDTLLLKERTDIGPRLAQGLPRFKLVGRPGTIFFAEVVDVGSETRTLEQGDVIVIDAYDVAHSVPGGMLAPEKAALAVVRNPARADDEDPVPLFDCLLTEWREQRKGGIELPDGRRSDDVRDGISKIHSETLLAVGDYVPRSDNLEGRLLFGDGPDTPTLHWGGRRLRFVPWARTLAVE
jgi:hypothetical protein